MQVLDKAKNLIVKLWNEPMWYWSLVAITFVVSRIGTWIYPFDSDHWIFFYVGKNWFRGGSLYVTAWDHKPPVIFFINGLMSLLSDSIVVHRVLITGFALLDIYLFYLLAKMLAPKILSKKAELFSKLALLLYVFWRNLLQFTSSGNNNENFGLVFYLGMLLSYFSFREDRKWWKMLLSGTCFAVLFFMKGNFLLLAVPIGILLFVDFIKELQKFFLYGLTFCLPLIVMAGAWAGYFASKGSFNDFVVATFSFSAKYSASAWKGDLSDLKVFYVLVAFAAPLIVMVPLLYLADVRSHIQEHEYIFFALSLLFGSFAFFAVGVPYLYYFLILMPVYILAATYLLLNHENYNWYLYFILAAIFIFGMGTNFAYDAYQTIENQISHTASEATEYKQIASYIDDHTVATDKVFDADYGATFYQLAHRDSGSRFVSASVLLLDYRGNYGFHLDDVFASDMNKSQAKYVVVYRDRTTLYYQNKPMVAYFDSHYHLEKTFDTFEVLRRN